MTENAVRVRLHEAQLTFKLSVVVSDDGMSLTRHVSQQERGRYTERVRRNYNKRLTQYFLKIAIGILLVSNHNSFRELLDKIASYILFEK